MRKLRTPRTRRKLLTAAVVGAAAFGAVQSATAGDQPAREYIVVYEQSAETAEARAAVADAGGAIVEENTAIGVATARSSRADFVERATAEGALLGAAANKPIGHGKPGGQKPEIRGENRREGDGDGRRHPRPTPQAEPLAHEQWDMAMIGATPRGSYREQQGSRDVLVGIIDTGVDASHPDIAPNFVGSLSRNFTSDRPDVDGECEDDPDGSCTDPANVDEAGHGTHVAGTVGAALNGVGIGGVAPRTGIVNLRAGQDSGYFFLQATVDALTFAGDRGIDVVNMSYFIDPWLYNCRNLPEDSPDAQAEQRVIIEATQRALRYAHKRGVTLVAAAGNQDDDMTEPEQDTISPDYPPGNEYPRNVDNSCLSLPTEGDNVISVTALGPSKRKSYYSNYGWAHNKNEPQADLSAPGGDRRDPARAQGRVLSSYPKTLAEEEIAGGADPTLYVTDGTNWWTWFQGTSMASPHAAGVAALIVAEEGRRDRRHGGLTLDPQKTEQLLRRQATDTPCPEPRTFQYPPPVIDSPQFTATCEGSRDRNGFYGDGIVDAAAVDRGGRDRDRDDDD